MTYYFYNGRIKSYETPLDSELYEGYVKLTPEHISFWQSNPNATVAEIEAMQITVPSDDELFLRAKHTRQGAFNQWVNEQSMLVREFSVGSKVIKLKANDNTKQNLQDLKGVLDDQIALGMFDVNVNTFDGFFNDGEAMPISITYSELLQIRLQIAGYLQNVYMKMKTVPAQINAIELSNYAGLSEAVSAINNITWE